MGQYGGTGTLSVLHGGTVSTNGTGLIGYTSGVGTVTVDGAGSALTSQNSLVVGLFGGTGTLNLQNGGTVSTNGPGFIGFFAGTVGTLTVDGEGSALTSQSDLNVGYNGGTGTLNLQNGGSASAVGGTGVVYLGSGGGIGTLNIGSVGTPTTAGTLLAGEVSGDGIAVVNFNQTDTITFSAALTGDLSVNQNGTGTTILTVANSYNGTTTVNRGTLVLDYTASDTSKLGDSAPLVLGSGTLQLDRSSGATGSHVEVVGFTSLTGTGNVTRGSGSTAVLQMNSISHDSGSVNFGAINIATTDNTNSNGILGGWATVAGKDWAVNSGSDTVGGITVAGDGVADGFIRAFTDYTDVTRLDSGPQVIADGATTHVRIVEGTGTAANITLGATTTTIDTLNQSTVGGTSGAVIDLAGKTLQVNAILVGSGAGALTLGTSPGSGELTGAGEQLILQNYGSSDLMVNSAIIDNADSVSLWHFGTGTTRLTGINTFTGATNIRGGTLKVSGGGKITQTESVTVTSGGTLMVDGEGSALTSQSDLNVGYFGTGTLSVLNGGTVSTNGTGYIGNDNGSVGTVTVDGAGSTLTSQYDLNVGRFGGTGTLSVLNGGTVSTNGTGYIGYSSGAVGTVTVDGVGSAWTSQNGLFVGYDGGTGTLSVLNGGTVESTNDSVYIGAFSGAVGTVTVDGAGSALISGYIDLNVGHFDGTGTLNLQNGGSASVGGGGGFVNLGVVGGVGTLNIGSTETPTTAGTLLASVVSGQGTAVVNFNQTDTTTFLPYLSGSLAVNQNGPGTTVLAASNNYSGATNVHAGTLVVNNRLSGTSSVTVDTAATLAGAGTIEVEQNIQINGTLSVGDPTLVSAIASNLTLGVGRGSIIMGASSHILMDLFTGAGDGDNTLSESAADRLTVFGTLNATAGGTLVIGNPNTMIGFAAGDQWQLFGLSGSIVGTLALDYTALHLRRGLSASFDQNTGIFEIIGGMLLPATHWLGGGEDSNWSSANWASDVDGTPTPSTPTADDDITFTATGATNLNTVLDADFTIKSLTINNTVSIGGEHTLTVTGDTRIDSGALTLQDGVTLAGTQSLIGTGADDSASVTVTGEGTKWTSTGDLRVGDAGDSNSLTVQNGGAVNVTTGLTVLGRQSTSDGNSVLITGEDSKLSTLNLTIGSDGTNNTFTVAAGGNVTATGAVIIAENANSSGKLKIGNGATAGSVTATAISGGLGTAVVAFDHTDDISFDPAITGSASVTKDGEGITNLTAASTYTGTTNVNVGALAISGSLSGAGDVTVASNAILTGGGSITTAVDKSVFLNGILNVQSVGSNAAATFSVTTSGTGAMVLGAGSVIAVDLLTGAGLGDNTATAGASDSLSLTGTLNATEGGTLLLGNPNHMSGFVSGDKWQVVNLNGGAGSITGTLALSDSSLGLSATQAGSFDQTTGVYTVVDTASGLQTAAAQDQAALSTIQNALGDINGRLYMLRAGGGEEGQGGIASSIDDGVVMGYGDGPEEGSPVVKKVLRSRQWEVFTTVNYANVSLSGIGTQAGVDSQTWSPTVGIERHFTRGFAAGFAVSMLNTHQEYANNLGDLDIQGIALSAYGSYVRGPFWTDLLYSFGALNLESDRNPGTGLPTAHGDTHGTTHSVQFNTGWNFRFNGFVTGPFLGVDYTHVAIDAYTETGGGIAALAYGSRDFDSLVSRIGWSASKKFVTNFATITPQLRISYERQNITNNNATSAFMVNLPFTSTTQAQSPGQDYMVLGTGVSFVFNDAFSLMLNYQVQLFRQDMQAHFGAIRFSYSF